MLHEEIKVIARTKFVKGFMANSYPEFPISTLPCRTISKRLSSGGLQSRRLPPRGTQILRGRAVRRVVSQTRY